ncbi:MAG TPA: NAD(P)-dependent oxidoreductase, partial [Gemmatimonadaceae bacterium]|nr:NAD(P)-dependent oxidoreductase [Gemmatimonadaceae bacterium]
MTAGALPPVVLTGATGFVGRRVLHELSRLGAASVHAVARNPVALPATEAWRPEWRATACDLSREPLPAGVITPGCVVLHLAAATGKATPREMRAVNVDGTRRVLDAAKAGGAAHVVFVSSIAASFGDQRWYHYAHAKRDAEGLVAASGLPCSIVRPTMIFGSGSPIQAALGGLAAGAAPIVLGSGRVRVQPIHVDDLAAFLVALAGDAPAGASPMEVGGGECVTMRDLLARLRSARGLPPRTPRSIPLGVVRSLLGAVERVVGTALPVTAGQLASFVNDSSAEPHPVVSRLLPSPRALAAMLPASPDGAPGGPVAAAPALAPAAGADALANEFAAFARHLGAPVVDARLTAAYVRAHQSLPAHADDRFDAWLYTWGRRGRWACT